MNRSLVRALLSLSVITSVFVAGDGVAQTPASNQSTLVSNSEAATLKLDTSELRARLASSISAHEISRSAAALDLSREAFGRYVEAMEKSDAQAVESSKEDVTQTLKVSLDNLVAEASKATGGRTLDQLRADGFRPPKDHGVIEGSAACLSAIAAADAAIIYMVYACSRPVPVGCAAAQVAAITAMAGAVAICEFTFQEK